MNDHSAFIGQQRRSSDRPGHRSGNGPGNRPPLQSSRLSDLRIWWREIDRVLLGLIVLLMAISAIAVAASSPASARRLSTSATTLPDLFFFYKHMAWQAVAFATMIGVSMLTRDMARRFGLLLAAAMLFMMFLVPIFGADVNGARRWIDVGMRFQPSEFLKPSFAIALAWILSWRMRDPDLPVMSITTGCIGIVVVLLALQPNFGAAILFAGVWFVLILLSGLSFARIGSLIGVGAALLTMTYFIYDNARHRIDAFFGGGTAFDQVDLAERTLLAGGWTGTGFWLGLKKMRLPEAHTDYIFSVIAEEFGLIACGLIVLLYLAMAARVLMRMIDENNLFTMLASAGLISMIVGQAFINILVNLQLFPSKGMTLPLISYGGSSTIAMGLMVGLLLAITRRNPHLRSRTAGLAQMMGLGEEPQAERAKGRGHTE